jgi:hypothetical protein
MPIPTSTSVRPRRAGSSPVAATPDGSPTSAESPNPTNAPLAPVTSHGLSTQYYLPDTASVGEEIVTTDDGHRVRVQDAVRINGVLYHRHDRSLFVCSSCYSWEHVTNINSVQVGRRAAEAQQWCSSCAQERSWECGNCHRRVSESTPRPPVGTPRAEHRCPACTPLDNANIFGRLLNYSDRNISDVPAKDTSSILFGLEVEVHVANRHSRETAIADLHRLIGPGYYVTKPDGSVDNGFEIVTRPDSMAVHREEWVRILEAIDQTEFLKSNLRSHASPRGCCGIHCHVDKSMLGSLQLAKLNLWINHPNNRSFMEKVAGRGANSYTSFLDEVHILDGARLKSSVSPQRYVALNVGRATVEFRMFKGTLNPEAFFRNLDFIEASVEWTGLANCSLQSVKKVSDFAGFVFHNKARFPFLFDALKRWAVNPTPAQ